MRFIFAFTLLFSAFAQAEIIEFDVMMDQIVCIELDSHPSNPNEPSLCSIGIVYESLQIELTQDSNGYFYGDYTKQFEFNGIKYYQYIEVFKNPDNSYAIHSGSNFGTPDKFRHWDSYATITIKSFDDIRLIHLSGTRHYLGIKHLTVNMALAPKGTFDNAKDVPFPIEK